MWETIGIIVLIAIIDVISYLIGHMIGYRDGKAEMIKQFSYYMDEAKSELNELRQRINKVTDNIDKM